MGHVGVDIGGTKVAAGRFDSAGQVVAMARMATPREPEALQRCVLELVERVAAARAVPVGVGVPGVVREGGNTVVSNNVPAAMGYRFRATLEERLDRAVVVENDARCFTISELHGGAAHGAQSAVVMVLGTGIGSGLVFHGRVHHGGRGIAGELGQMPFPGRDETVEEVISGPALERAWLEASSEPLVGSAIGARAQAGDPVAQRVVAAHVRNIARAIGAIITVLDPDVVVLGGGVASLPGLISGVNAALPAHTLDPEGVPEVRLAGFPEVGGVRGASLLPSLQSAGDH